MKKTALILAAAFGILLASCTKDDDFKELKDGKIGVSLGDISLGLPVGSSDLNAGQLLQKWQGTQCEIIFENNLLTLKYEDTIENTINFTNGKKGSRSTARKDPAFVFDTLYQEVMSGELDIDLFESFPNLEGFTLEGIRASLSVTLKANMAPNTQNILSQYIDDPYVSELSIKTTSATGVETELPIPTASRTFTASQLASENGVKIPIYDKDNSMDDLIQSRPKKMSYRLVVNVPVHITFTPEEFLANYDFKSYFNDIVELNSFNTKTEISARFPLRVTCTNLVFTDTIDDINLSEIKESLSEATDKVAYGAKYYLAVKFTNSIPLSFTTNDKILDSYGNAVKKVNGDDLHLFQPGFEIRAADTQDTLIGTETYYYSKNYTEQHMLVPLTKEDIDAVSDAKKLALSFTLNTKPGQPAVSLRDKDHLKTAIYILVNPNEETMARFGNTTNNN